MKKFLIEIGKELWKNKYWLIIGLITFLLLWLPPKIHASELSDYMDKEKLMLPKVAMDEAYKQDLIAACGIAGKEELTSEEFFMVYFTRRLEEGKTQTVGEAIRTAIMRVKFLLAKKKVVVEYLTMGLWAANEYRPTFIRITLQFL